MIDAPQTAERGARAWRVRDSAVHFITVTSNKCPDIIYFVFSTGKELVYCATVRATYLTASKLMVGVGTNATNVSISNVVSSAMCSNTI